MMSKPITPDNLEKAGFTKCAEAVYLVYCLGNKPKIKVVFWIGNEPPMVVIDGGTGHPHTQAKSATTMQDIYDLMRLFLGIQPEPQPITAEGLEALGFERSTDYDEYFVLPITEYYTMCFDEDLDFCSVRHNDDPGASGIGFYFSTMGQVQSLIDLLYLEN